MESNEFPEKGSNSKVLKLVNFESFPEDLLMEVLIRIHPMLVCRFKLVSKQWFSIISDPFFIRNNLFQASLLPQPWKIISCTMLVEGSKYSHFSNTGLLKNIHSQAIKPSYCVLPLPSTQPSNKTSYYKVYGVSNGIVLYGVRFSGPRYPTEPPRLGCVDIYYICNPVSGQWIALPPYRNSFCSISCGFVTRVENGVLKSFRVVRLNVDRYDWYVDWLKVEVFFSETGEWKHFTLSDEIIPVNYQRGATDLNGVLHYISAANGIIAYDPYQNPESKRLIAFPRDIINNDNQNGHWTLCDASQGKLRLIEVEFINLSSDPFQSFKIWVLEDYSSGDWCLQHAVNYKNIQYDVDIFNTIYPDKYERYCKFTPLCFHPFNSDIVFFASDDEFVSYNIKTQKVEFDQEFFGDTIAAHRFKYFSWSVFVFIIPPWPVFIPHFSFTDIDYD